MTQKSKKSEKECPKIVLCLDILRVNKPGRTLMLTEAAHIVFKSDTNDTKHIGRTHP